MFLYFYSITITMYNKMPHKELRQTKYSHIVIAWLVGVDSSAQFVWYQQVLYIYILYIYRKLYVQYTPSKNHNPTIENHNLE